MKPSVVFLRVAMVCALVFFVYAAMRKGPNTPPSVVSPQVQPASGIPEQPRSARAPDVQPTPEIKKTVAQNQQTQPAPAPVDADVKPALQLTPIAPSSGAPDSLSFTLQQCRHAGEQILCYGTVKNNAEIAQSVQLEDSKAVDDQGRSFTVYLFGGGFSFDTGSHEKLNPGIPVRFSVKIADPYPRVKTVNLDLRVSMGRTYYPMVFKDVPVQ